MKITLSGQELSQLLCDYAAWQGWLPPGEVCVQYEIAVNTETNHAMVRGVTLESTSEKSESEQPSTRPHLRVVR